MSFATIASGTFPTRSGVMITVNIQADASLGLADLGELRFPADEPLIIEWSETSKEETICSSSATLKVISPGDRTYQNLYTIKPALIRLDVLRDDSLYWSGTLDPEFYEEPYTDNADYEVSFTFSDLGMLSRLKYNLTGIQTLKAILSDALTRLAIDFSALNTDYISLMNAQGAALSLDDIAIRSDNFTDENGEVSNLEDVITGILQPLALRIIQRAGNVYVYDLNALYNNATTRQIQWAAADQTMSVDKVYNNAKISFSPYADTLLTPSFDWQGLETIDNPEKGLSTGQEFDAFYPSYDDDTMKYTDASGNSVWDYGNISFCIIRNTDNANSNLEAMNGSAYFKIVPFNGGEEAEGVVWGYYTGGHGSLASGYPTLRGKSPATSTEMYLMKTARTYLPALDTDTAKKYRLQICLAVLFDVRYNPFESASAGNENGNYETVNSNVRYMSIPFKALLYDNQSATTPSYHYANQSVVIKASSETPNVSTTLGAWTSGDASWDDAWLMWYDKADPTGGNAWGGWQTNRQAIWALRSTTGSLEALDDGQYIPYPPQGGWLEIQIGAEVITSILGGASDTSSGTLATWLLGNNFDAYGKLLRWRLYKLPEINLIQYTTTVSNIDNEDIVYEGTINSDAEESLDINTICGTATNPIPTSRGNFLLATDASLITSLQRASRIDTAEQLLIGTWYSQFANRHLKLAGTTSLDADTLTLFTEASATGKKFLITQETQTIDADEAAVTLIETSPDEYTNE